VGWPLIVSIVALGVSVASAVASYLGARAQTRAQERLVALESARERGWLRETRRARLVAQVVSRRGQWRLVIRNEGSGAARDIRVRLEGRSFAKHDWIPRNQDEVTDLGPAGEAAYIMAPHMGSPRTAAVEISWADDSGQPGVWTSQLNL
jgi:hypothetical protein